MYPVFNVFNLGTYQVVALSTYTGPLAGLGQDEEG